jgi:hypothetical protein
MIKYKTGKNSHVYIKDITVDELIKLMITEDIKPIKHKTYKLNK